MKAPKQYECLDCGFISNRSKTMKVKYGSTTVLGFAICYKCRGHVKEREEWKEWQRTEFRKVEASRQKWLEEQAKKRGLA
ncbi:hypothetical protein P4V47_01335 [Brevibacillus laterosporus]|uniref:hypothetical protein n=1 Tax=Brevibacillus laterosporus TaxID=1465 RepID=UPI002E1D79AE|nr:hypothetical protein [Brevibacillus laterosporus]